MIKMSRRLKILLNQRLIHLVAFAFGSFESGQIDEIEHVFEVEFRFEQIYML